MQERRRPQQPASNEVSSAQFLAVFLSSFLISMSYGDKKLISHNFKNLPLVSPAGYNRFDWLSWSMPPCHGCDYAAGPISTGKR